MALIQLAAACGDDSTATESPTTTRQAVQTSISGAEQPGLCDWYGGKVEILEEVSCDQTFAAAQTVLAEFPDQSNLTDPAARLLIARVCAGAQGDTPMTYPSAQTHIAALADALVGSYCPGDRAKIVPE